MARTAPRSGRTGGPGLAAGALAVLVLAAASAGCVSSSSPHHVVPTRDRLDRVSWVEVEVLPTDNEVRRLDGTEFGAGPPAGTVPRIQVSLPRREALAEAVIDAGSCGTGLPFRKVGRVQDWRRSARLTVELESVTLATGDGPDPPTVLWIEVRTRLQLPDHGRDPGSARHLAADPSLRRLSEWVAGDGARLREAVSVLAAGLAPRLVADLGGGKPVKPCDWDLGAPRPDGAAEWTDVAPPADEVPPRDAPPAPVATDVATIQQSSPAGVKVLAALGGGVAGVFVGAVYGLGTCAQAVKGGGGGIGLIAFAVCSVVAVPVGAVAGSVVGMVKGVSYVGDQDVAANAAMARANTGLASQLAAAVPPDWMEAVLARADQALAAGVSGEGAASRLSVGVVRLVEERGGLRIAQLEMEAILHPAGDQLVPGRHLCLRSPGPIPTELWFRDDAILLRRSIEANVAAAVERGAASLSPRPGDGPCVLRGARPPVAQPSEPQSTEFQPPLSQ